MKRSSLYGIVALLAFVAGTSGQASPFSIHKVGKYSRGTFKYGNEYVRFFSGEFKGGFNTSECESAANTIKNMFMNEDLSAHKERVDMTLDPDTRFLIIGHINITTNRWYWVCVNEWPDRNHISYIRTGHAVKQTDGWARLYVDINGYQHQYMVGAQPNGDVAYHFFQE